MDRKFFSLPQRTDKLTVNQIHYIFSETYKELRPTLNCPIIYVEFYQFVGINHTIRLKEDKLYIRLSDLFKDAPTSLMEVLATILFSFQIYGDFSGYSDIAIGVSRTLNSPYFS